MKRVEVIVIGVSAAILLGGGIAKALDEHHPPPVVTVSFCDTPGPAGCANWVTYNPSTGACRVTNTRPGEPAYALACEDAQEFR